MIENRNSTAPKIHPLGSLSSALDSEKAAGKTIVHCHGVFDLLHIGHIRHFEEAKGLGDILVVTITADDYVNKGPHRPAFGQAYRTEAIAALECVDYVAVNHHPLATDAIMAIRPDYYVKGSDYKNAADDRTGGINLEKDAVDSVGGQIVFTNNVVFSSTSLINRHVDVYSQDVKKYLADFTSKYSSDDVISYIDGAKALKVLVVGETIIDEYWYCETLGKSGKEPILATRHVRSEIFAGGIIAVANHVAAFNESVSVLTFLGSSNSHEELVREKLSPGISETFLYMTDDAPTIVKRRFLESYPPQKLFEVYEMGDGEPKVAETDELCAKLAAILPDFDIVIVADYGHGMMAPEVVDLLCDKARFLAVNTQVNAGNGGFNTISKYRRADFVCISEAEIRLDARTRRKDIQQVIKEAADRLSCEKMVVTRGQQGCLCYGKQDGFSESPAIATKIVDRVGAGDTVFALTTLLAAQGAPMEIAGFVANVAGAQAVATIGNRESLAMVPIIRQIESLLK